MLGYLASLSNLIWEEIDKENHGLKKMKFAEGNK